MKKWIVTILAAAVSLLLAITEHSWARWLVSFAGDNHELIEHLNTFADLISKLVMWPAAVVLFIFGLWQKRREDNKKIVEGDSFTGDKTTTTSGNVIKAENVTIIQGTAPASPPPLTSFFQLPPPPADFTGRTAELRELRAAIEKGGIHISGLQGQGGVGKTALALKLAAELAPKFPDAQIYLDLKGVSEKPLTAAEAMSHVLRTFHPEAKFPEKEQDLRAQYLSVLHNKRALLLMDNAKDAAQIRPLIPPPGCTLLVTSRQHFALPGLQANNLETLPPPDAKDLLLRIAPRIDGEADTIARLCGYLPQALQLAASAISMRVNLEPQDYARQLGDKKKRLELLAGDDESIEVLRQHPRERVRWCEEALKAARQLKNRAAEGRHLGNLGIAYFDLGDQRRAIECQEESMAIARELDDRLGEGTALGNLGLAYKNLGDYRRAIGYYEQHLSIAREIGHRQGEAHALGNLGNAYYLLGEARRALEYHTQALVVDRAIGRWRGEGDVLWNMSEVLDKLGNRKKAIEHAEASLEIREQIKDPGAEEVRKQLDIWKNG